MMSTNPYDPHHHLDPVHQQHWPGAALLLTKDQAEEVKSVWSTVAMVLKGYDAIPMELKILLDRLLAAYHDTLRVERRHRLAQMGWSEEDYARGYKLEVGGTGPRIQARGRWHRASGATLIATQGIVM